MNYRALEDLVNILVKKTGYKLSDLKLEEDIDSLEDRKKQLEKELSTLQDRDSLKSKYIIKSINREIEEIDSALDIKYNNPVILGNKLLDAYRNNDSFESVSETFETLVKKARGEYEKTHEEVKNSNIFELIDKYTTKKRNYSDNLESNTYSNGENKDAMILRVSYHNSRIEELKRELEVIDKKKEEILALQNDADDVIKRVHKDIDSKNARLNNLLKELYSESNISPMENVYKNLINNIRYEISDLTYLEGKYNDDVKAYKSKVKELDARVIEVNERITIEEKTLAITQDKLDQKENDLLLRFKENIECLDASNRVENLMNEQQYLYVNIDVIKEEIINLWNRDNKGYEYKPEVKEEKKDLEEETKGEISSSMYEEELPDVNKSENKEEHNEVEEDSEQEEKESDEDVQSIIDEDLKDDLDDNEDDGIEVIDYLD